MADILSETSLVSALRAGNHDAFETLVRLYMARLLAVARRFLKNEEDARDAVQDAFISAFRSIQKFEAGAKLSTWLHRIVVNSALMRLRTKRRHPEEEIDELMPRFAADGHHLQEPVDWRLSAEEMVQQSETRELVRKCIDRLPDSYRLVLLMRDIEEMSTGETAAALEITATAVKVRLHRARQALRALIDKEMKR